MASVPQEQQCSQTQDQEDLETYAKTIQSYARRSQGEYLICGEGYKHVARLLNSPPKKRRQQLENSSLSGAQTFELVVCKHFVEDQSVRPAGYSGVEGLNKFQQLPELNADSSHLVFLRGYPASDWLRVLGAKLRVDPEYLRQQLRFMERRKLFDIPTLPSSSRNILNLRITTIYTRQAALTKQAVEKGREESAETVKKHQIALQNIDSAGDSIVRRYSIHSENTYTIGQNISCCVVKKHDGWAALIWLDVGKDISQGPAAPWASGHPQPDTCLPVIQHPPVALRFQSHDNTAVNNPDTQLLGKQLLDSSTQSAKLLPTQYGSTLDADIMRVDAMYALSELFTFAACNESQFINFVSSQVEEALRVSETQEKLSLSNLWLNKSLLDEHVTTLQENVEFLKNSRDGRWPQASQEGHITVVSKTQEALLRDFECLIGRAKDLRARCVDGTTIVMNRAMLQESRNAIHQATKVKRLTVLAFFFVPISLLTSVFGMNFNQLGQGEVSIVWFIPPLAVVICASAVFCFWETITELFNPRAI